LRQSTPEFSPQGIEAPAEPEPKRVGLTSAALRLGMIAFAVASLVGFGALVIITRDVGASLGGFLQFDLRWALPAFALASLDWFGGGLRVWLLLRPLEIRLSYWRCVEISGTTAALAYLTPSGAGGGPAQLYGLVRRGVAVGRAAASNFASVVVNLTFLSLAGLAAWFFGASSTIEELTLPVAGISASKLFEWSAFGFGTIGALVVVLAVTPRLARAWILRLFGTGPRVRVVVRWLQELHGSLVIYVRKGKLALVLATLSGSLQFGGRFLLGWCVLRGFGIDAGFVNIVMLHVMLQFLLYFMPTPGGSGIGEVLAPAVMSPFMPSSLLFAYTAVWRFFLTYVTVGLGGALLIKWITQDRARLGRTGTKRGESGTAHTIAS